jgi:hypothetical protein
LLIPESAYENMPTEAEPMLLGFECHRVLADRGGEYDYFCYLEDDLVIHDPWFFQKLAWFNSQTGKACVLQPNRYELAQEGGARKSYLDGELAAPLVAPVRDGVSYAKWREKGRRVLPFLDTAVTFERAQNPHSGCSFLTAEQLRHWRARPDFGARDSTFIGPLESAATLGLIRTFRVYKPAPANASFLEIEHDGDRWIRRLDARDEAAAKKGAWHSAGVEALDPVAPSSESHVPSRHVCIQALLLAAPYCPEVRIHAPHAMLARFPGVRIVSEPGKVDFGAPSANEGRVLVWERPLLEGAQAIPKLNALLARGYAIVVEYDDDPVRRYEHVENDFLMFRGCHAVQVSTAALADVVREFNPNVAVFENQVAELPPWRQRPPDGPTRVFFGALNRGHDWAPLMPALNRTIGELGDAVEFCAIGDQSFFEGLATEKKAFHPLCDYARYNALLSECDVGLLPLHDTRKNRLKSDLKFIECAAHGVAVLASSVLYSLTVEHERTGLIYDSPASFAEQFRRLVVEQELRGSIARSAYNYVREHRQLKDHVRKRFDWYVSLLDRREELTRDLFARTPELGPMKEG